MTSRQYQHILLPKTLHTLQRRKLYFLNVAYQYLWYHGEKGFLMSSECIIYGL